MESLPPELVRNILMETVRLCRCQKNEVMKLRLVCHHFDDVLKEYIFKTIQLEFSRYVRGGAEPDMSVLPVFGRLCQALYCDMMIIRDQEELARLDSIFNGVFDKLPEMRSLLKHLDHFCLSEGKWDESDFCRIIRGALQAAPNLRRLKLSLPFQVIGKASGTATLLLTNIFACWAERPDDFETLETLVLDHVTDSTALSICRNPFDLKNALKVFKHLKNFLITLKRQENSPAMITLFAKQLWLLISEASQLESLCIYGWCTKNSPRRRCRVRPNLEDWNMKSFPYDLENKRPLKYLKFLELRRIDIDPTTMVRLIEDLSTSLKELYLNETHLKILNGGPDAKTSLWIGHGPDVEKGSSNIWIAEQLLGMESLKLDILRVTGLGYDHYGPDVPADVDNSFDLVDPLGLRRSFDERFVRAVMGIEAHIPLAAVRPVGSKAEISDDLNTMKPPATLSTLNSGDGTPKRWRSDYDADTFQRKHNTTSHWKRCIDGQFFNHNDKALTELQRIITIADMGTDLLSAEIEQLQRTSLEQVQQGGQRT